MIKTLAKMAAKELAIIGVKQLKKVVLKAESDLLAPSKPTQPSTKDFDTNMAPVIDIKTGKRIA